MDSSTRRGIGALFSMCERVLDGTTSSHAERVTELRSDAVFSSMCFCCYVGIGSARDCAYLTTAPLHTHPYVVVIVRGEREGDERPESEITSSEASPAVDVDGSCPSEPLLREGDEVREPEESDPRSTPDIRATIATAEIAA